MGGVTQTHGRTVTSTWSWSLKNSLSVGFAFFGFSIDYTVSFTVSQSVATAMSDSLSKSMTRTCSAACGFNENNVTMWQWQMDVGEVCKFGEVCPFTVYSCHFQCRSGVNDFQSPRCPLTQCADAQCNTCLKPELDSETIFV